MLEYLELRDDRIWYWKPRTAGEEWVCLIGGQANDDKGISSIGCLFYGGGVCFRLSKDFCSHAIYRFDKGVSILFRGIWIAINFIILSLDPAGSL